MNVLIKCLVLRCVVTSHVLLQKLARLLHEAADEGGYVDDRKVEEILGISREEAYPARMFSFVNIVNYFGNKTGIYG